MSKKKLVSLFLVTALVITLFSGCVTKESPAPTPAGGETKAPAAKTKVGMVTDSGTIDDKSFNQGTWEGIVRYEKEKGTIEKQYLKPKGEQETDYINAINDLIDSGYKLIVTPGYKFETAINKSAATHKDTAFILIDGQPHEEGKTDFVKHDNVVSVFFNEHEAGFLAGVASALSTKSNKLGFIGGMKIPPVQRFHWGFEAGVRYANKNLGTKAEIVDAQYQGSFNNVPAGQTLAAGMYSKGVDIIFHAAGGVGVGVFNEAKQRAEKGEKVYVVGVDVDQYADGLLKDGKTSVTLTSAIKKVDVAAYNYIDAKLNNKFPGGEVITLSLKQDGVGLPKENPNLSSDVTSKIDAVKKDIVDGKIIVPGTEEDLAKFLK
ncbi:BMP family ABC transporter substrate-binding protein [Clostridium sp. SYSU_GA19001]|uniref:BMP family lipoprotein n=1 Tax=Clostridium caldaquaticum TaxID=2940653 RepID=UPI0020775AD0|nr:BMP family ABC transporter substrate-binding protein [Clostridium caldaquaticum]MCM8711824.1 BMP family ABC transporter substrate-binding protein [Clostridium caldaquaticum]